MDDKIKSVFRLPKRHAGAAAHSTPALGGQLVEEQSLPNALFAGLVIIIIFSILWAMASTLLNRILPWMTLILGILVGLGVRRAGKGLDWRFPLLAAVLAVLGALLSNIVVAAAFTASALDTSTLHVLRAVTAMTWPVFFDEALSVVDVIYGFVAAALAAFYANRRLTRAEFHALRTMSDGHQ
jgi:hypothetical protein